MYAPLTVVNRRCVESEPLCADPVSVRYHNGVYQVTLSTHGCRQGRRGSCTMCNYGLGGFTDDQLYEAFSDALSLVPSDADTLLIGSCGSVLDPHELSPGLLGRLLTQVSAMDPGIGVIIETRYDTVRPEALAGIRSVLGERPVDVEMGLESVDPDVLSYSLNKGVDPEGVRKVIEVVHGFGMRCTLNVMFGSPLLSYREQVRDSVRAIRWACENGADTVVLFPMHVKRNTFLALLYDSGRYECVPLRGLLDVLSELNDAQVSHVVLSWVDTNDGDGAVLHGPVSCPVCRQCVRKVSSDLSRHDVASCRLGIASAPPCSCGTSLLYRGSDADLRSRLDEVLSSLAPSTGKFS